MRDSRIGSPKLAQETGRLVCHGWRSKISGFELHRKDAVRISGQGSSGRMGFPALFFFLALAAADPAAAGGPRVAADGRDSQLWEVAQGLEAHFMKEMIRNMRKTVQEGPEMANNRGYQLFRGMLDDQYAENAARGGQGIGLAEIIVKQILESQENVQRRRMPVRELNKSDVIRK